MRNLKSENQKKGKENFEGSNRSLESIKLCKRFPSLKLAGEALACGGAAPIVLNAANEIAVQQFLNHAIPFLAIPVIVEETLSTYSFPTPKNIAEVIIIDKETRKITEQLVKSNFDLKNF